MCENVRLEVCGLGEPLVATVEWTYIRSVTSVDAYMRSQVEVKGESLAASLKCTLHIYDTQNMKLMDDYALYSRIQMMC